MAVMQAYISKLENETRNPSVNLLKRLADGMGMALKIEFVPKQKAWLYDLTGLVSGEVILSSYINVWWKRLSYKIERM